MSEKGCGELTIPYGYCDGKDFICLKCSKKKKRKIRSAAITIALKRVEK